MTFPRPRSELVVSMTLAEMFLLFVFLIWYTSAKDNPAGTVGAMQAENERLKKENERLKNTNGQLQAKLDDVAKSLEFWRTRFGQYPPTSERDLATFIQELGRGKPKCQEKQNVLIEAQVVHGQLAIRLVAESPDLYRVAGEDRSLFAIGKTLDDEREIGRFLRYVREVEAVGGPNNKGCRFDYHLHYATYKDEHDGRERLEDVFYAAGRPRPIDGISDRGQ
jgi:hypothetical protein